MSAKPIARLRLPRGPFCSSPVLATATTPPSTSAAKAICHQLGGRPAMAPKISDVAGYDMTMGSVSDTEPFVIAANSQIVASANSTPEVSGSQSCAAGALGNPPVMATHRLRIKSPNTVTALAVFTAPSEALSRAPMTSCTPHAMAAMRPRSPGFIQRAGCTASLLLRSQEILPSRFEMLGDLIDRRRDVAVAQRVIDRPVLLIVGAYLLARQDDPLHALPLRLRSHVVDLLINVHDERIAGAARELQVKLGIPPGEPVLIGFGCFQLFEAAFDTVQILLRRMQCCELRHIRFDREPRLDELQRTDQIGDIAGGRLQRSGKIDEGPAADAANDEAF